MIRTKQSDAQQVKAKPPRAKAPPGAELPFEVAVVQLAKSVDESYRGSPCYQAWRLLKADRLEGSDLLSSEAQSIFEGLYRADPDEPLALHHLAIIHHGRAIQQHLAGQGAEPAACADWRKGLQAWADLLSNERFWESLRGRWQTKLQRFPHDRLLERLLQLTNFAAIRSRLPAQLLRLHVDIIVESLQRQKASVAKAHFALLCGAPLPANVVAETRKSLYQEIVGDTSCKDNQYADTRQRIENYLMLESDSAKALTASVRLALSEAESHLRDQAPERAWQAIEKARPHAEHPALRAAQQAAEGANLRNLLRDFFFKGARAALRTAQSIADDNASRAMTLFEKSYAFSEQAIAHGQSVESLEELREIVCANAANTAIGNANFSEAHRFIDRGLSGTPNDPQFLLMRAISFKRQGDFSGFNRVMNQLRADPAGARFLNELERRHAAGN